MTNLRGVALVQSRFLDQTGVYCSFICLMPLSSDTSVKVVSKRNQSQ